VRVAVAGVVLFGVLPVGLLACGDGDEKASTSAKPKAPAIRVEGREYAFVMPDRIKGGVVAMDFSNPGRELHEYSLSRLHSGKTLADVDKVLAKGEGPTPDWFQDIGGVPVLTPAAQIRITRKLQPGSYVFLCFIPDPKGRPHHAVGMKKLFSVVGDSRAKLPSTDGVIIAGEKAFTLPTIKAGRQTLELRNSASKPREFNLVGLRPGKTDDDAQKFFAPLEKGRGFRVRGKLPLEVLGAMQSIEPGTSVYLTTKFKRGWRYRLSDNENEIEARFRP
jgi:hypothetical protein